MALLLLPARGDRDADLPLRGRPRARPLHPRAALRPRRARARQPGGGPLDALRAQDGDGLRQDQSDVAGRDVVVLQRALRGGAARRLLDGVRADRAERHRLPAAAGGLPRRRDLPLRPADPAGVGGGMAVRRRHARRSGGRPVARRALPDEHPPAVRRPRAGAGGRGAGGADRRARRPPPGLGGRRPRTARADAVARRADGAQRRGPSPAHRRAGVGAGHRLPGRGAAGGRRRRAAGAAGLQRDAEAHQRRAVPGDRRRLPDRAGRRGRHREAPDPRRAVGRGGVRGRERRRPPPRETADRHREVAR